MEATLYKTKLATNIDSTMIRRRLLPTPSSASLSEPSSSIFLRQRCRLFQYTSDCVHQSSDSRNPQSHGSQRRQYQRHGHHHRFQYQIGHFFPGRTFSQRDIPQRERVRVDVRSQTFPCLSSVRYLSSASTSNLDKDDSDNDGNVVDTRNEVENLKSRTTTRAASRNKMNRAAGNRSYFDRLLEQTNKLLHQIDASNNNSISSRSNEDQVVDWHEVRDVIQKWGRFNTFSVTKVDRRTHQRQPNRSKIRPQHAQQHVPQYVVSVDRLMSLWIENSTTGARGNDTIVPLQPDSESYKNMILIHSKCAGRIRDAARRAEYWLQQMIEAAIEAEGRDEPSSSSSTTNSNSSIIHRPRGSLYALVLSAWEREMSALSRDTQQKRNSKFENQKEIGIEGKENNDQSVSYDPVIHGERLFQQWHDDFRRRQEVGEDFIESTNGIQSMYYMLLSIWAKSNHPDGPVRAEALLREMVDMGRDDLKLAPSIAAFVNVISAWEKKEPHTVSSAMRAQNVLDLLIEEHLYRQSMVAVNNKNRDQLKLTLNDIPFNATIQAWTVSTDGKRSETHRRIDDILLSMKNVKVKPTNITVSNALAAYDFRRSGVTSDYIREDSTMKIDPCRILRLLNYAGNDKTKISIAQLYNRSFDIVLSEISQNKYCVNERQEILDALEKIFQKYLYLPVDDRITRTTMKGFDVILEALVIVSEASRREEQQSGLEQQQQQQRILHYLQEMKKEATRINDSTPSPSIFLHVARAWARSAGVLAKEYTPFDESLNSIDLFLQSCRDHRTNLPKATWFGDIADASKAYVDSRSQQSSSEAEDVKVFVGKLASKLAGSSQFYRMLYSLQATKHSPPDKELLDSILDALVHQSTQDPKAGQRAELILLAMQELNLNGKALPPKFDDLSKVITCQLNSNNNARRASEILVLAEKLYEEGDTDMRPTYKSYMSVIDAWSSSDDEDAPTEVQRHLKTIEERRLEGWDDYLPPNPRSYAALIRSFANSNNDNARDLAETIFKSTPEVHKTTIVYNALISAQNGDVNRAELLLHQMHNEFMNGNDNVQPDTESFNSVLAQWLKSGSPIAASRSDCIFQWFSQLSESGELQCSPNTQTFDLVISTLAQDWGPSNPLKVDRYLSLLKHHYKTGKPDCRPSVTSYNEAIRAWGSNIDDPRSVLRAKALVDEMHELARSGVNTARPNEDTYELYLQSVSKSSPERRAELIDDFLNGLKDEHVVIDKRLDSMIKFYQAISSS